MVIRAGVLAILAAVVMLAGCAGNSAFNRGEKYAVEGDWDRAVAEYRQALKADPDNIAFKTRLVKALDQAALTHVERAAYYIKQKNGDAALYEAERAAALEPTNDRARQQVVEATQLKEMASHFSVGENFFAAGRPNEALEEFQKALSIDPTNARAQEYVEKITRQGVENADELGELELGSDQPVTLSFKDAKLKEVFEFLSKLAGVSILFDEDVKDSSVTVFARDVSFKQALNLLLATNKLFMKKIAKDAIIIIPKTKSKQDQYQDLQMRTFYLSAIQAKEMVNIIRTMLETRKVIVNDVLNSITIRDTPEKLKLVEKLIEANDKRDAEVVIDVEVMSVDKSVTETLGVNLPTSVTGTYIPPTIAGVTSTAPTSSTISSTLVSTISDFSANLKSWASAKNNIWFNYPSVTASWQKLKSNAETLTNPQIRTINNKPAKILIGSRIPVQTGTVLNGSATTNTFEYRDVGIKLTVEPDIGLRNDISMKVTLEVSSLGDSIDLGTSGKQPTFNTTTAEATLSLKDGETVIVGGLQETSTSNNTSGVYGLMDIPILGKLLSSHSVGPDKKRELVMTLTPHIVRAITMPPADIATFWSGTEEAYDTKPLFEEKKEKLSVKRTEAATSPDGTQEAPQGAPAMPTPTQIGRIGTVGFAPEIMPVDVGQEVTIDVTVLDLDSVFEAPLSIIYNPKLAEFIKADEGEFMKTDGKPTSFMATANDKVGYIDVFVTRLGKVPGMSGSGKLFSLTFKGKAPGISPLVFKQNTMKDANKQPVNADLKSGTLYVK